MSSSVLRTDPTLDMAVGSGQRNARSLVLVVLVAFLLLFGRLLVLQIFEAEGPRALAAKQVGRVAWRWGETLDEHPVRGPILDRCGRVLAESWYETSLVIDPAEWLVARRKDLNEQEFLRYSLGVLALALEDAGQPLTSKEEVRVGKQLLSWREAANGRPLRRIVMARGLLPDTADRLDGMLTRARLMGWRFERRMHRAYPYGRYVGQLVGTVGEHPRDADGRIAGRTGLELWLDACLSGVGGVFFGEQDRFGREYLVDWKLLRTPKPGGEVHLTIDAEIQRECLTALEEDAPGHLAKSASVVVLEARTGEILAACSWPSVDPNDLVAGDVKHLRLGALADVYQPGSAIKPVFVSWALHTGVIGRDEVFDCGGEKGYEGFFGRRVVREFAVNPEPLDHRMVLVRSSNVGAVRVGLERLGVAGMYAALDRFGFEGPKRMVAYPESPSGRLPDRKTAKDVWEGVSFPMGYNLSISLLGLARLYMVFANGGEILEPTLVKETRGPDGTMRSERRRTPVLSMARASEMLGILREVVSLPMGTGIKADSQKYPIAGKSGTAKNRDPQDGSTYYDAFFCGIAPADDPRVIVALVHHGVRHRGPGTYTGGSVSGPTVRKVIERILPRLSVPPRDVEVDPR